MTSLQLVCLLPARNAVADLPGFFASAARFADAVVALDDGSTDETAELLAAHPLVIRLLRNPRRPDYRGWNDAANRNRLLAAAAEFDPGWIVSVDADERIDAEDARALRDFLASDALPGLAYGFRCYPMFGDPDHVLPTPIWVYRLFAFAPGQRFPERALHFAPVPTSIPRRAFVRTTLRIQHLGGLTREHRTARYEKYRQADPDRAFWPDYTPLLSDPDPSELRAWKPRPHGLPVLGPVDDAPLTDTAGLPRDETMSVVLLGDAPAASQQAALHTLEASAAGSPVEPIVALPTAHAERVASVLDVPTVTYGAATGDLRRAAVSAAQGTYLLLLPPTLHPSSGAFDALLRAHQRGFAMAAATVTDGSLRWQERADFLLAFGGGGRKHGVIDGAPRFCSYARALLDDPSLDNLDGATTNRLLARRGYLAYREPDARFTYRSNGLATASVLASAFRRGVAEGNYQLVISKERGGALNRQFVAERVFAAVPRRIAGHAAHTSDPRVRLLTAAGELTEVIGMAASMLRPAPANAPVLLGRPTGTLLVAAVDRLHGACRAISLVRFDLVAGNLLEAALDPATPIPTVDGAQRNLAAELGLDTVPLTLPSRFAIDDVFARRFEIAVDDVLLLAVSSSDVTAPVGTLQLGRFGSVIGLARLLATLRRGETQSTLSVAALVLLCRGVRRMPVAGQTSAPFARTANETFAAFAARVRLMVAPPEAPRHRTPRDALKLVEWA